MTADHTRTISPREAARLSCVSRSTIMRALSSRELRAIRDNRNAWQITPDDLDEWLTAHRGPAQTMTAVHQTDQIQATEIRAVRAETERDAAIARAEAAERDRDRWQAMAEKLAERPRPRWWPWRHT